MMNNPPPFKDLNVKILIIIPIKGMGLINHGSGLASRSIMGIIGVSIWVIGVITYVLSPPDPPSRP